MKVVETVYFDKNFEMTTKDKAVIVKFVYDNGLVRYGIPIN